ncbi:hypothetical protein C8R46DRAFT_1356618 [Mycena filopes]|nr:hypothetical protein C8R46DRAFT_1356618 [Mycena filopes]
MHLPCLTTQMDYSSGCVDPRDIMVPGPCPTKSYLDINGPPTDQGIRKPPASWGADDYLHDFYTEVEQPEAAFTLQDELEHGLKSFSGESNIVLSIESQPSLVFESLPPIPRRTAPAKRCRDPLPVPDTLQDTVLDSPPSRTPCTEDLAPSILPSRSKRQRDVASDPEFSEGRRVPKRPKYGLTSPLPAGGATQRFPSPPPRSRTPPMCAEDPADYPGPECDHVECQSDRGPASECATSPSIAIEPVSTTKKMRSRKPSSRTHTKSPKASSDKSRYSSTYGRKSDMLRFRNRTEVPCPKCFRTLSRPDALKRHLKKACRSNKR